MAPAERARIVAKLTPAERAALFQGASSWDLAARPDQRPPPGAWTTWLILAGRGWGKTRTGAETVLARVRSGAARRVALVGRTAADVRDVMIEGESGILACAPADYRPAYEPSKRRLTWPDGAIATAYSADQPDLLRGPQHDFGWIDELASWEYADDAWSNLRLGLRLGSSPAVVVTTTPRPTKIVRELMADPGTVVTRGSTYDNRANLAPAFFAAIIKRYEGSRLGRQELLAEILDDAPGALWRREVLDAGRVREAPADLVRVVVAIDPAVTATEESDESGIVVAGLGPDGHAYVLADASGRLPPREWAARAVRLYHDHRADAIVAEVNNGGDLVAHTLAQVDPAANVRTVHASRGKRTRAEPVAALFEQGRAHLVGAFPALEDQLLTWDAAAGAPSPDRLDALVWALNELIVEPDVPAVARGTYLER